MKTGSADTHTLAQAAGQQATNTENLALAAKDQVAKLQAGVSETHDLAKATQDILAEQRPYIWAYPESPIFEEGKILRWNVHFKNYGNAPAIHVHTCAVLSIGATALRDTSPSVFAANCKGFPDSNSISPPTFDSFVTLDSPFLLDADQVKYLQSTDGTLVIIGFARYQDTAGRQFKSTFCYFHLSGGASASCSKYNEVQ
jgi:hypothetical protein